MVARWPGDADWNFGEASAGLAVLGGVRGRQTIRLRGTARDNGRWPGWTSPCCECAPRRAGRSAACGSEPPIGQKGNGRRGR